MIPQNPQAWDDVAVLLRMTPDELACLVADRVNTDLIEELLIRPGARRELDGRDLVRGMLACVLNNKPMTSDNVAEALARIDGGQHPQRYLPYPTAEAQSDKEAAARNAAATRVRRLVATLLDSLDGSVGPNETRLPRWLAIETQIELAQALYPTATPAERDRLVADREAGARRHAAVVFQPIIDASLSLVPVNVRSLLDTVSLDGTAIACKANGNEYDISQETLRERVREFAAKTLNRGRRRRPAVKAVDLSLEEAHEVALADLHRRKPSEDNPYRVNRYMRADVVAGPYWRGNDGQREFKLHGYEAHVVATHGYAKEGNFAPRLALAATVDTPGFRPWENGLQALEAAITAGRALGMNYSRLVVDRLYNDVGTGFWWGAQSLGLRLLVDLEDRHYGWMRNDLDGFGVLEGALYCAAMPDHLANATKDFRAGKISAQEYDRRIEARRSYLAPANGAIDLSHPDNRLRFFCPARYGGNCVGCVRCGVAGLTRLAVKPLRGQPMPAACQHTSLTLRAEEVLGMQALPYNTPEWKEVEDHFRNIVEGLFGDLKKHGKVDIDGEGWAPYYRLPGYALCLAVALAAYNVDALLRFLRESRNTNSAVPRKPGSKRRARNGEATATRPSRKGKTTRTVARAASARSRPTVPDEPMKRSRSTGATRTRAR